MYLDSLQLEVTDQDLTSLGWTVVRGYADLPPLGVPVLLRVLTPEKDAYKEMGYSLNHLEAVTYYVGRISRLVPVFHYGMKISAVPEGVDAFSVPLEGLPSTLTGSYVKPECFIELPHGGVYCQNLQISAWQVLPDLEAPCWKKLSGQAGDAIPKVPVVVAGAIEISGLLLPRFFILHPMDIQLGIEVQEDEEGHTYYDDEKTQPVLLSTTSRPDGKDSDIERIPIPDGLTYYVPEFPETVLTGRILTK